MHNKILSNEYYSRLISHPFQFIFYDDFLWFTCKTIHDDGGLRSMKSLADTSSQLVITNGTPKSWLTIHHWLSIHGWRAGWETGYSCSDKKLHSNQSITTSRTTTTTHWQPLIRHLHTSSSCLFSTTTGCTLSTCSAFIRKFLPKPQYLQHYCSNCKALGYSHSPITSPWSWVSPSSDM